MNGARAAFLGPPALPESSLSHVFQGHSWPGGPCRCLHSSLASLCKLRFCCGRLGTLYVACKRECASMVPDLGWHDLVSMVARRDSSSSYTVATGLDIGSPRLANHDMRSTNSMWNKHFQGIQDLLLVSRPWNHSRVLEYHVACPHALLTAACVFEAGHAAEHP